jgi:hypothetical protein
MTVDTAVDRLRWLLAHPEAVAAGQPATPGEAAEMRHLADPALDYTAPLASKETAR